MAEEPPDRFADDLITEFGVVRDLREPAAQALLRLGELRLLTEWDDRTLCAQLGCDPNRWVEVGGTLEHDADAVANSLLFLTLASECAQLVDLTLHRREVVNDAFQLCHDAGGPVASHVPRVREALDRRADGEISPRDLLRLGEIARAWRSAALNMDGGPAHERALAAMRLAAPAAERVSHISPQRLALLSRPHAEELLGPTVTRAMRNHLLVSPCAKCRRVAVELGLGDMLAPNRPTRSGDPLVTAAA